MSEIHPSRNSGCMCVYRDRFTVAPVYPEIKLCEIDKTPGSERQRYVVNKPTIIANLSVTESAKRKKGKIRPIVADAR